MFIRYNALTELSQSIVLFRELKHHMDKDKMRQSVILVLVFFTLSLSKSNENHSQDAMSKKISHDNIFERKSEIRTVFKTVLRGRRLKKQNVEDIFPPSHLCRKGCHFERRCGKCVRRRNSMFRIACNKRLC